jgi:hypothetical protein
MRYAKGTVGHNERCMAAEALRIMRAARRAGDTARAAKWATIAKSHGAKVQS